MSNPPNDFRKDIYGSKIYTIKGRPFQSRKFDIIDASDQSILYARPRRIISSATGIFSTRDGNQELVFFKDISSARDVYIKKKATSEFRDGLTKELIGMLRTEGLENIDGPTIHILNYQGQTTGVVEGRSTPGIRSGGKPSVDIYTGTMNSCKVFELKVNLKLPGFEMQADFSMDEQGELDRRFGLALAVFFAGVARTIDND